MVMERLRRLMFAALVALAVVGLSTAGCAPEFTDDECETDDDCFPNERCNQLGFCIAASTSDAGPDGDEDAGDAGNDADAEQVIDSVTVDPEEGTVQVGGTLQLEATALDESSDEISGVDFTWSSDDEDVVTVSDSGEVTGVAEGSATISAEADGVVGEATIEVVEPTVDSVELSTTAVEMFVNETVDVDAQAIDANGNILPDAVFIWSVEDDTVASVDSEGVVTGVGAGETTLTANSEGVEASIPVTVSEVPVETVEIEPTGPHTIENGTSDLDLDATPFDINGSEITGRDVDWTSEDDTIASVDADGIVTGESVGGPVDITATIGGVSASVAVEVIAANQAPTADAGSDTTVNVGETASLDGSNSSDPDGDSLSFSWAIDSAPSSSTASLSSPSSASTDLTPDVAGEYTLSLSVDDGNGGFDTDTVVVTANGAPSFTSTAVTDIDEDSTYTYDITTSDPNTGDALTITAELSGGGSLPAWLSFTDAGDGTATLTGTPTNADVGTYDVELTVDDGTLSDTQTFTITVNNTNDSPTASFTYMPPSPRNGQTVSLDASGSGDPDAGDSISSYEWLVEAPDTTETTLTGVTASFTADQTGDWIVQLTVTDGNSATGMTSQTIAVAAPNNAPTFTSTPVAMATEDTTYTYDITTDDADGDAVTITAALQGGGTLPSWLTFTDAGDGTATLTGTPTNADVGDVDVELTVDDGIDTSTQTFTITVSNTNDDPVASFTYTPSQPVLNDTVNLDGSGSSDPDASDSIASYAWTVTDPSSNATSLTGATPTFAADEAGDWTVELTVTDGNSATNSTTQTVSVTTPPSASDDTLTTDEDTAGDVMVLSNDSDPDGDTLAIDSTTTPANGSVSIQDNSTPGDTSDDYITYTPDTNYNGSDSFDYTIVDGNGGSATATVNVTVTAVNDAPTADAGADQTTTTGTQVTLDASGSSDVEDASTSLTYSWTFDTDPSSGADTLSSATTSMPTFTPSVTGDYILQVEVTDTDGATDTDTVTVTVN